ncbi:peptidase s8 and s53 subtilisin kexin sedolisin [Flammeovirgaceae bacterium 311]|nr:peptidase s8 and s53 subtilisin kexin sedolisin [Flammeovirgaceae bacterium 311]
MQNNYLRGGAAVLLAAVMGLSSCQQDADLESVSTDLVESNQSAVIEGQYIVVLKEDAINGRIQLSGDYETRKAAVKSAVLSMFANARLSEDMLGEVYGSSIYGFAAKLDEATVARLRKDPGVASIEQDRIIMLAPPAGKGPGGGGGSTTQATPWGITRVGGAADGTGKTAWVIDSGIDLDHPDLNVDASRGFNAFTSGRDGGSPDDGNGHGTHVAGTIAAKDNSIGVVGVAYNATVVPIKVLDSRGSGSYSGVIAGVDFVAANGKSGDVANMSLGGPVSDALDLAVVNAAAKGVKFVLAAGNETDNANNHSPARANGTNVYTISAMNSDNRWASFSNFGNPPVDYCAPGVSINSTWKDGGYNTISGTSMAAPHAAGVLLLGAFTTDGTVIGDPDGNPDGIIVRSR